MLDLTFIDFSHANITAILAIPLAVFSFFVIITSLLILRQSHQMMEVLPTPLSPLVRILTILYLLAAIFVFALILIVVFS